MSILKCKNKSGIYKKKKDSTKLLLFNGKTQKALHPQENGSISNKRYNRQLFCHKTVIISVNSSIIGHKESNCTQGYQNLENM